MMEGKPSRRITTRLALFAAGVAVLAGAAEPAHPPLPREKPKAATDAQKPVPPPDKGEAAPVPTTRPPESEGGEKAVPQERPADTTKPHEKPGAEEATPPSPEKTPEPAARPDEKGEKAKPSADTEKAKTPEGPKHVEAPAIIPTPGVHEDKAALEACYHDLDALGVDYSKEKMINDPGVCGIEKPISVRRILPDVTLKPENRMRCATALALARWTRAVVEPSAEALGKDVRLTGLSHGSAYVCKLRNSADHGKVSEHAFGSAVDVVTFEFAHHDPISIEPRERTGKIEEGFQRAVIGGACLYFTTVLGPHADEAHEDNLHLDVMERSSGFRLCE
ncbi:MAG: extensin family protein [Pararhizobium sp.]